MVAIREFPRPTSLRKLREFLGLVNFHHRFIPHCATLLDPLNNLLSNPGSNTRQLLWNEQASTAFTAVKEALAEATLLSHPKPHAPTCIMADASECAVGAVLQQEMVDGWRPIAYFSRRLRPAERKYSTFDRELLAVYLAIKHFCHFVEEREFFILTDHKPLTFALSTHSDKFSPRQVRHLDFISQFTGDIRHVSGGANAVADALSRAVVGGFQMPQPTAIDFRALAEAQTKDQELQALQTSSSTPLKFAVVPHLSSPVTLICDISTWHPTSLRARRVSSHSVYRPTFIVSSWNLGDTAPHHRPLRMAGHEFRHPHMDTVMPPVSAGESSPAHRYTTVNVCEPGCPLLPSPHRHRWTATTFSWTFVPVDVH